MKIRLTNELKSFMITHLGYEQSNKLDKTDIFIIDPKALPLSDRGNFLDKFQDSLIGDDEGQPVALAVQFLLQNETKIMEPAHTEINYFRQIAEKEKKAKEQAIEKNILAKQQELERLLKLIESNKNQKNELENYSKILQQKKEELESAYNKVYYDQYIPYQQAVERMRKNKVMRFLLWLFYRKKLD